MIERSINANRPPFYISGCGRKFEFKEYSIDACPKGENDLFVFCTEGIFGFNPLFVGKAENLPKRLQDQDLREAAKKHGATKLLVHSRANMRASGLADAEAVLIDELRPTLNVQRNTPRDSVTDRYASAGK